MASCFPGWNSGTPQTSGIHLKSHTHRGYHGTHLDLSKYVCDRGAYRYWEFTTKKGGVPAALICGKWFIPLVTQPEETGLRCSVPRHRRTCPPPGPPSPFHFYITAKMAPGRRPCAEIPPPRVQASTICRQGFERVPSFRVFAAVVRFHGPATRIKQKEENA